MDDANCDSETRSGTDIKLGLERYFSDKEASVLCWHYRLPGKPLQRWRPGMDDPDDLFEHVKQGGKIRGFNVIFEWMCWNRLCVPLYGWPELPMEQLVDTMAEVGAMNLPQSLERAGLALRLPDDKLKSKRGKWLIRKLCVPQKITKNQPHRWLTPALEPELHAELWDYCDQDVVAEESIAKKVRRLTQWEWDIWFVTQKINQRGVPVAVDEVAAIHDVVLAETARLNAELVVVTAGAVPKASNRAKLLKWLNEHPGVQEPITLDNDIEPDEDPDEPDPFLPDMRGDTIDKVLARADLPHDVRRALEIRRAVCQTSTAKFPKLLKIVAQDHTLKNMHVYHGAGPGRWASRGGFNVQNLKRPTIGKTDVLTAHSLLGILGHEAALMMFGDKVMDAAAACLRGIIKAPEGYEFLDADYSSVENRVAAWISGQHDKLDMFSKGLDEYKTFASKSLFKVPYDEVTPKQRQDTKPVILGGIFGLGAEGLVDYADKMGVKMTLEFARDAIKVLRADYHMVKQCWYDCGNAALDAVRNPGQWQAAGEKLSMIFHRGFLWMKLPSGRLISWANPLVENLPAPWTETFLVGWDANGEEIWGEQQAMRDVVTVEAVDTYTRQWGRHKLIGSSIFQSAVQGTARDVLASGILYVEEAGYSVRMLVHDELLALVRKGEGDPEEFGKLMCKPRDWFKDLPLAYEAWRGIRFRK